MTRPFLPLSLPVMTMTVSSFFTCSLLLCDSSTFFSLGIRYTSLHCIGCVLKSASECFHQMTSGAREMIFMKSVSRSSRATGPKIRVPRGLLSSRTITAAFSSNEI